MEKYKEFITKEGLGTVIENGLFANITTLKVGGKINVLFYPNSYDNFLKFYRFYLNNRIDKENPKVFIIGNGSNVLASDSYYNGIVICFKYIKKDIEVCFINNEYIISAYSGTSLISLSNYLIHNNFTGGEFLHFIPGLVGGAVTMNASCYGNDMASIIKRVLCINQEGILKWYNKEELDFSYRDSLVKRDNLVIIKVEFKFKKLENNELILNKINEYKSKRILSQPIGCLSAGSVFKNKKNKSAWKIVEELGFKGYDLGNCKISDKHSNFIVNNGGASSKEIYRLVKKIKNAYFKKYNEELECEWILVNFDE